MFDLICELMVCQHICLSTLVYFFSVYYLTYLLVIVSLTHGAPPEAFYPLSILPCFSLIMQIMYAYIIIDIFFYIVANPICHCVSINQFNICLFPLLVMTAYLCFLTFVRMKVTFNIYIVVLFYSYFCFCNIMLHNFLDNSYQHFYNCLGCLSCG